MQSQDTQAKKIVILGSTGSLGVQALEAISKHKKDFRVVGLSADISADALQKQAEEFEVEHIVLAARDGAKAVIALARLKEADIIVNVLSGIAGIAPSIAALKTGKTLLLGNKESLVAEGARLMKLASGKLIPLDSEHNAIYEILQKYPDREIKKIILPCSGGPFLGKSQKDLEKVTAREALAHPKWKMGDKISIESATFINKGLEILEACHLFKIPPEKIEVKIHPDCLVHGIVEFENETIGYISSPDMEEHIENGLLRAANLQLPQREIRPLLPEEFNLYLPTAELTAAISTVLNARNHRQFLEREEKIIEKFLRGEIRFSDILAGLRGL